MNPHIQELKEVDIDNLCNNQKLGSLTFDRTYPLFKKLKDFFLQFDALNYESELTEQEVSQINSEARQFLERHIKSLAEFTVEQDNAKTLHDNLENDFENFYTSVMLCLSTYQ